MSEWDPRRNALGQFGAGNSGRPPGARNRGMAAASLPAWDPGRSLS